MRKFLVFLVLVGAVYWGVPYFAPDFFLGGIQVNEADHGAWVAALDESGMNTVAVTVYAKQGDWDSANLWFDEEAPWVVNEIRQARARGLESVLVLRVALDHAFERNKYYWHGMIAPSGEEALEEWFERYSRFVLPWAEIAEREGVAVLAVASELNAMTNTVELDELPNLEAYYTDEEKVARQNAKILDHQEAIKERHLFVRGYDPEGSLPEFLSDRSLAERAWARQVAYLDAADPLRAINARRAALESHWRRLIAEVRERFSGRLTYAANFDQYEEVGFWDDLDLFGINAYFSLRSHLLPSIRDDELAALLESRWLAKLQSLESFRRGLGLPRHRFVFTELGYVRRANSTLQPWASDGFSVLPSAEGEQLVVWQDQEPDLVERSLAVRGLYRANVALGGDLLAGLLYWKLSTEPAHVEIEPFVVILGAGDPLEAELAAFTRRLPWDRLRSRVPFLGPS